ncbi:probable ubiquitin carboxyl-terminal hydrolase MINDY-4 [Polypterus senegalus]|uniref:probable ubiquitin carboxyl-terminal hydrolase MINDY-4 n=1 Tax=Polypterus senegalus TaxID=55291 RepID=UPI00196330A7|nr:probable ubiquitin carboxyl-terminal hydrolase MINDY-4 [Polypterus senegalus]
MDNGNAVVEEVAASLVREYLSRKGLKKTIMCMDEELPRTDLSINNRNELRKILHLDSLYKKNKVQKVQLKAMLEIIVKHLMETTQQTISTAETDLFFIQQKTKVKSKPVGALSVQLSDVADDETGGSTAVSEQSKTDFGRSADDKTHISYTKAPFKTSPVYNKAAILEAGSSEPSSESERENLPKFMSSANDNEGVRSVFSTGEVKNAFAELQKQRSTRPLRGMMAGPISSSQDDCSKKRIFRRYSASNLATPLKDEDVHNRQLHFQPANTAAVNNLFPHETDIQLQSTQDKKTDSASKTLLASQKVVQKLDFKEDTLKLRNEVKSLFKEMPSIRRKDSSENFEPDHVQLKAMEIDDIEEDERFEGGKPHVFSSVKKINVDASPIDLNLAIELKKLLFGSSNACFNEEWKIQSFVFSELPDLRYGIVQKKGGSCGILASVQACVLQKLLFEDGSSDSRTHKLKPLKTQLSKCLALAIAEILWRAGEKKKAVVALSSGRKHFIPAGRYKTDGILETVILNTVNTLEDLTLFLEQNIQQFELGPYGCILLTLSAIFSRSMDLIRKDFDVPSNTLIGAHGYCTQELVNLLLTGKAVSNVFNDEIQLDSGNGNITLLKGVKGRSDIGLLSLFEHYNVCKVGSYLKTPRYPIWVVCSESHFSVLFCLRKELLSDWRIERRFDLYYYDGLANQEDEIRLTVDTSQSSIPETDSELTPPLEHCIRTKWKGALIDWNGTEPIL